MDLIERIEACRAKLAADADDVLAAYRLALAYARAGAPLEAKTIAERLGIEERFESGRGDLEMKDWEDIGSLIPRLRKDAALREIDAADRSAALAQAAEAYEAVAARTAGWYPLINAATLRFLAGDRRGAEALARKTLALIGDARPNYWAHATAAEAHLLLGDTSAARREMQGSFDHKDKPSHDDVASTLAQFRQIAAKAKATPVWFNDFAPPPVAHYVGHIIGRIGSRARLDETHEAAAARAIEKAIIDAGRSGPWAGPAFSAAYGALAAGADILVAERMIAGDVPLHVVLPYDADAFLETSVAPYGDGWVGRYRRCLDEAADIRTAAEASDRIDGVLLAFGSRLAMGLTRIAARRIGARPVQVALWDGHDGGGDYGTAADVRSWRETGGETVVATPPSAPPSTARAQDLEKERERVVRAILFTDVKGFSKLPDRDVPKFTEAVFGAFEDCLAPYRNAETLLETNTWGDALLAVFNDVRAAANCALALFDALETASNIMARDGEPLGMRIGGHYGPIFETYNAVLGRVGAVGAHVSTGARVEPKTPVGSVWVTERFAAELELAAPGEFLLEAIGRSELAKNYGSMRVYRLAGETDPKRKQ